MEKLRNFCITAHIDHGKSTLADRILELTGTIHTTDNAQVLDSMELERERGITIKAKSVRMPYHSQDGQDYILNLIDTPGHVDFNYEVSRSFKACEGAVLLVDASQGVEAQTIANAYLAIDAGLEIIPVINKIDLPGAMLEECRLQLEDLLGPPGRNPMLISAKDGTGVPELLEAIVTLVPPPKGAGDQPLQALIFDSYYDAYRGVISHVRLFSGTIKAGDKITLRSTGKTFEITEVGYFVPDPTRSETLTAGEVGYIAASVKEVGDVHVGDTIVSPDHSETPAIPGFRKSQPMVFCGIYPVNSSDYGKLTKALEKFQLNDSSLVYTKESSAALGHGYRLGFMGMLHMEIATERLKREYGQDLIATVPSVAYKVFTRAGEELTIENPSRFPDPMYVDRIEEPIIRAHVIVPNEFVGVCMDLSDSKRGTLVKMENPDRKRTLLTYDFPLAEMITGYFDKLKSVSRGYADMDYELFGYKPGELVKVDVLVKGSQVDALSFISIRDSAVSKARTLIHKLRKTIPRHQFEIPLQAAIGSKVIAREDIAPMRKDVLAKCYGGDITRKRKLLEKQKEGKKKMKMVGAVEVPQEAFLLMLKADDE
jgi:GTP-binding protein LepA